MLPSGTVYTDDRIRLWKWSYFNPLQFVTPQNLSQYLYEFDFGTFNISGRVLAEIQERSEIIASTSAKRSMKAESFAYEITKKPDANATVFKQHQEVLKYAYDNLRVTDALDQDEMGGIQGLFGKMNNCQGMKWQCFEIIWRPNAENRGISPTLISAPLFMFQNRTGKMRYLTMPGDYVGEEMLPDNWMVCKGLGLLKPSSIAYMNLRIALQNWLFYTEAHGCPGMIGLTNHVDGSDGYAAIKSVVERTLGPNFKAVLTRGSVGGENGNGDWIQKVDFAASGPLPYEAIIESHEKKILMLWEGGDLASQASKTPNSVGSNNQMPNADSIEDHDALKIQEALNFNIDPKIIAYHFGDGVEPAAYIKVYPKRQPQIATEIQKFDFALNKARIPVGIDALREGLGLPAPEDGEEIVEPPPVPVPGATSEGKPPFAQNTAANATRAAIEQMGRKSMQLVAEGKLSANGPLAERILGIIEVYNSGGANAALIAMKKFRKDAPDILHEMNQASGQESNALEQMQIAEFVNGMAESTVETGKSLDVAKNTFSPDEERDKDGKWTSGGASAHLVETKRTAKGLMMADGKPLPEHIQKLGIPPAWKNVTVSQNPEANLLAKGFDAKGRVQSVYSDSFAAKQSAQKFARVNELRGKMDAIKTQNDALLKHSDPKVSEAAAATRLIQHTGIRPGSDNDTGADKKAYGATTLKGSHVIETKDGVRLQFVGKKGVSLDIPVHDKTVADDLVARAKTAGQNGKLFKTSDSELRDHVKTLDGGSFKPKDFRTALGTSLAAKAVSESPAPHNEKEFKQYVKRVAETVSKALGNTPTIALQSYIHPSTFSKWREVL